MRYDHVVARNLWPNIHVKPRLYMGSFTSPPAASNREGRSLVKCVPIPDLAAVFAIQQLCIIDELPHGKSFDAHRDGLAIGPLGALEPALLVRIVARRYCLVPLEVQQPLRQVP